MNFIPHEEVVDFSVVLLRWESSQVEPFKERLKGTTKFTCGRKKRGETTETRVEFL
jgi:hypothetical protein